MIDWSQFHCRRSTHGFGTVFTNDLTPSSHRHGTRRI